MTPQYTNETPMIITTNTIKRSTIAAIIAGMGWDRVITFVQDGDCGFVQVQGYEGDRVWYFVATLEAAQLITGAQR